PSFPNQQGKVLLLQRSYLTPLSWTYEVIDSLYYQSEMHSPFLSNVAGISLERTTISKNEYASASTYHGGASPGLRNSQELRSPYGIWLETSTESDNRYTAPELPLQLHYNLDRSGLMAKVTIFDLSGKICRQLLKHELIGTNGTVSWDGLTDSRSEAIRGLYTIYVELYDHLGFRKKYHQTFNLSQRK